MTKIIFTGGGTGGHIFPLIAIHQEIMKKISAQDDFEFYYIGPKDNKYSKFITEIKIKERNIWGGKIRRYFSFKSFFLNIVDVLFKTPISIIQAFIHIFLISPDLIFSKGGYGSFPVIIAGRLLGTPVIMHESDIIAGSVNHNLSRMAIEIFVSFPSDKTLNLPAKKIISTGNPIRKGILLGSRDKAKKLFNLTFKKPVILILGGSQGAKRINDLLLEILPDLLENFEVIHQCGENNFKDLNNETKALIKKELITYYHLYPFLNEKELANAYHVAELIISRAGSGSIFEIAAVEKPSILIPLPEAAQNHQTKNAYAYAEKKACMVIEENNLTPYFFLDRIKYLLDRPHELEKMKQGAKSFAKPRAGELIAYYIYEYLKS